MGARLFVAPLPASRLFNRLMMMMMMMIMIINIGMMMIIIMIIMMMIKIMVLMKIIRLMFRIIKMIMIRITRRMKLAEYFV